MQPLGSTLEPGPLRRVHTLARAAMFAALIAVGAFIMIPLGPLHISLQTMMLMLTGFCLGPRGAFWALLLYLASAFVGLPMLGRGRAGPAIFFGPSCGYLPGFMVGAVVAGFAAGIADRRRRIAAMALFGVLGTVLILTLGSVGLRCVVVADWRSAFAFGMLPFLPGDLVKLVLAIVIRETFLVQPDERASDAA